MKARIPVKPITLLGLMNVIVSKLLLLIVVSLFLPHIQEQISDSSTGVSQSRWFKILPGLLSESDALAFYSMNSKDIVDRGTTGVPAITTPYPRKEMDGRAPVREPRPQPEETRKKLLPMASVIVFDIVLSTVLTLSLAKNWFYGIWPWIVFRLVLACGLLASAFAIIIQNLTIRVGMHPEWDFCNVLSILATIMFANVYVVYSYYWNKKRSAGPPLLPMNVSNRSHHPMYSSIGQGSEETTITMELDDVVSLTPEQREAVEAAEIMDHKAGLAHKYSSFWETQQPSFMSKTDPNATL